MDDGPASAVNDEPIEVYAFYYWDGLRREWVKASGKLPLEEIRRRYPKHFIDDAGDVSPS